MGVVTSIIILRRRRQEGLYLLVTRAVVTFGFGADLCFVYSAKSMATNTLGAPHRLLYDVGVEGEFRSWFVSGAAFLWAMGEVLC